MLKVQVLIGALLLSGLVVLTGCGPDSSKKDNTEDSCFGRGQIRCDPALDELKDYLH